ncbi:MAG: c-type cytochrome [Chloroflexota bacterium]
MKRIEFALIGSLAISLLVIGCTAPPAPTQPTSPTGASQTIGQLSDAGKTVFAGKCAGCHGDQGQGSRAPAIVGSSASLQKYNTAQGLLDFISSAMPPPAPGSYSRQEYLQALCFLLVQNNFASAGTAFNENALSGLQLK